jgi:hypothetical protein
VGDDILVYDEKGIKYEKKYKRNNYGQRLDPLL